MDTEPHDLWTAWLERRDGIAFATLVRPEIRYAADYVRRLGASHAEAEDAVQVGLAQLASEASTEPLDVGLRAWLCRRTGLAFRMEVRSSTRRRNREREAVRHAPDHASADPVAVRDEVEAALSRLDADEREAITLRFIEDVDYSEMAHVLGVGASACRVRVHRALAKLRGALGSDCAVRLGQLGVAALPAEVAMLKAATHAALATTAGTSAAAAASAAATAGGGTIGGGALKVGAIGLAVTSAIAFAVVAARPTAPAVPVTIAVAPPPVAASAPPADVRSPAATPEPIAPPPAAADALDLLDGHFDGRWDARPHLWSADALVPLFPGPAGAPVRIDDPGGGAEIDLDEIGRRSGSVELGPGTFRVVHGFPRDGEGPFEIRGAGTDRTTLVARRDDVATILGRTRAVVLRDLAFDGWSPSVPTSCNAIDARGTSSALFERVRFQSWHRRAGYGAPIGVSGRAFVVFRECRFDREPSSRRGGSAIAVRGDVLALFERCAFEGLDFAATGRRELANTGRSAVHFLDCTFDGSKVVSFQFAQPRGSPPAPAPAGVRVRGGRVALGAPGLSSAARRALWGEPLTEECKGVEFASESGASDPGESPSPHPK